MARPKKYNHTAKVNFMVPEKAYQILKFTANKIYGIGVSEFMRTITPIVISKMLENRISESQFNKNKKEILNLLNQIDKLKNK
jgi:uncharacterized membrane protein